MQYLRNTIQLSLLDLVTTIRYHAPLRFETFHSAETTAVLLSIYAMSLIEHFPTSNFSRRSSATLARMATSSFGCDVLDARAVSQRDLTSFLSAKTIVQSIESTGGHSSFFDCEAVGTYPAACGGDFISDCGLLFSKSNLLLQSGRTSEMAFGWLRLLLQEAIEMWKANNAGKARSHRMDLPITILTDPPILRSKRLVLSP
ncbi:MAG: hypothetical protein J0M04_09150 [Verrucomicrobia bacterium]|nr:hypothetical protein [Verrucomicrobiota bacterium]